MRLLGLLLLVSGVALAQASPAQAPAAQTPTAQAGTAPAPALKPIGTVDDLMIGVIWPLSDDLFYVATRDNPSTDEEWRLFQGKMLMLAESANLLMMPGRAWDNNGWAKDSQRLYDAGTAAFKAAKAKDRRETRRPQRTDVRCLRGLPQRLSSRLSQAPAHPA